MSEFIRIVSRGTGQTTEFFAGDVQINGVTSLQVLEFDHASTVRAVLTLSGVDVDILAESDNYQTIEQLEAQKRAIENEIKRRENEIEKC